MKEKELYLDQEKKEPIQDSVEFEQVVAGETATRKIYVFNTTNYNQDVELSLEGEYVQISKTIEQLAPKQVESVEFEFKPKITIMKPITAKLKIKINYVIR